MKQISVLILALVLLMSCLASSASITMKHSGRTGENNGTLSGFVTDSDEQPIAGAQVRVSFHGTYEEAFSDETGYYQVTNIPICYCMKNATCSKQGYQSQTVWLSITEDTMYDFRLLPTGITHYVGGGGPANYTSIQDAIDNASKGDTVVVFSGVYVENVVVDTSLRLIGENRETTVIDGNGSGDVVFVSADHVHIQGFSIQNSGDEDFDAGLEIRSNANMICNNSIHDNGGRDYNDQGGLYLNTSSYNELSYNRIFHNDQDGIFMVSSDHNYIHHNHIFENSFIAMIISRCQFNTFSHNDLTDNFCCMSFWPYSSENVIVENHIHNHPGCGMAFKAYSNNNYIHHNNISNNRDWGIMIGPGPTWGNRVEYNTIAEATGPGQWYKGCGIILLGAFFNTIQNNNIMGNRQDVYLNSSFGNRWKENYWENYSGGGPKFIRGVVALPWNPSRSFPWMNIDWRPAQEPYDMKQ